MGGQGQFEKSLHLDFIFDPFSNKNHKLAGNSSCLDI